MNDIKTLAALKESDYKPLSIKDEIRKNYIKKTKAGETIFEGMWGYELSVIPDIELAILAGHNILFLGLRGQGKTRLARQLVKLLDEYIPVISGIAIPDDPIAPITKLGKEKVAELGDDCPIEWIHRSERLIEKLATPDVSVADLIGDVDPIKAATLRLSYSDERVIHYGLIPRAHRSIFILNELPDLQPRIQVSLFNILEEGDIQIRGFKVRLPLDIQFIFTANPEDYTNRGSIVTPLKDRIESQILTHYPEHVEDIINIGRQEAHIPDEFRNKVKIPLLIEHLIADAVMIARESEFIDEDSGVSERMNIAMRELVCASSIRRIINKELSDDVVRIVDLYSAIPAITGKMELNYEGEQEGLENVAMHIIGEAIEMKYRLILDEEGLQKSRQEDFLAIKEHFEKGNSCFLSPRATHEAYMTTLNGIPGLRNLSKKGDRNELSGQDDEYLDDLMMELIIYGFTEIEILNKSSREGGHSIEDPFGDMFSDLSGFEDDDDF